LQVGRAATRDAGFSNQDHQRIANDPALGIRIGTTYLRTRIERADGNLERALDDYNGERHLRGIYGAQIMNCARLVREGRVQEGLHSIHR
jgi:soluble lytic murein transglycosylase-like protein